MSEEHRSYRRAWCIAKSNNTFISQKIPVKKVKIVFPCPGVTSSNGCPDVECEWRCPRCGYFIEYGYGEYFFCLCGAALINSYQFKCSHSAHGNEFLTYDEKEFKMILSNL